MESLRWKLQSQCLPYPQTHEFTQSSQLVLISSWDFQHLFFCWGSSYPASGAILASIGCSTFSLTVTSILGSSQLPRQHPVLCIWEESYFPRGNSEGKVSCLMLPLWLSAQTIPCWMSVMDFLNYHLLWPFRVWGYFRLFSWRGYWPLLVANAVESYSSTLPFPEAAGEHVLAFNSWEVW